MANVIVLESSYKIQVSAISPSGNERFLSSIEVMTAVTKEIVKHWQIDGTQLSAEYLGNVVFPFTLLCCLVINV